MQSGGGAGLLIVFIVSLYKRWVVLGWQYDEMVEERDRYRAIAEKSLNNSGTALEVTKVVADAAKVT